MAALEQLNIRVTPELKQKFRDRALREGMTQQQLLDSLLAQRGTLPAPGPAQAPASGDRDESPAAERPPGPDQPPEDSIEFIPWLSGRQGGLPQALVRRALNSGRVLVDGVPWTSERIPKHLLERPIIYKGRIL